MHRKGVFADIAQMWPLEQYHRKLRHLTAARTRRCIAALHRCPHVPSVSRAMFCDGFCSNGSRRSRNAQSNAGPQVVAMSCHLVDVLSRGRLRTTQDQQGTKLRLSWRLLNFSSITFATATVCRSLAVVTVIAVCDRCSSPGRTQGTNGVQSTSPEPLQRSEVHTIQSNPTGPCFGLSRVPCYQLLQTCDTAECMAAVQRCRCCVLFTDNLFKTSLHV